MNNLLEIYEAFTGDSREAILSHFASARGYGDLKKDVVAVVNEGLAPIQQRYRELTSDVRYIDDLLARGAERAASVADATINTVRERMGFLRARG